MRYSNRIGCWLFTFALVLASLACSSVRAGSVNNLIPAGSRDGASKQIVLATQQPSSISLALTVMGLIGTALVFRRRRAAF